VANKRTNEPPTCEGYMSDEAVRKYLTFGEQLKQLKAAERPPPRKRRRRRRQPPR
jgi:hypothetical protein